MKRDDVPGPSRPAAAAIAVLGLINLVRGSIHVFADDGGAASIAGLDLSAARETIVFLFASIGIGQLAMGAVDLAVATRWRSFVRPLLLVHVAQIALLMAVAFWFKPPPTEVPGQWFNLAVLAALSSIAIYEFLPRRRDA